MKVVKNIIQSDNNNVTLQITPLDQSKFIKKLINENLIELLEYMLGCLSFSDRSKLVGYTQDDQDKQISGAVSIEDELKILKHNYRVSVLSERLCNHQDLVPADFFASIDDNQRVEYLSTHYATLPFNAALLWNGEKYGLLHYALAQNKLGVVALLLNMECHTFLNAQELNLIFESPYENINNIETAVNKYLQAENVAFTDGMHKALNNYQSRVDKRDILPDFIKDLLFYDKNLSHERLKDLCRLEDEVRWVRSGKREASNLFNLADQLHNEAKRKAEADGKKFKSYLYYEINPNIEKAKDGFKFSGLIIGSDGKAYNPEQLILENKKLRLKVQALEQKYDPEIKKELAKAERTRLEVHAPLSTITNDGPAIESPPSSFKMNLPIESPPPLEKSVEVVPLLTTKELRAKVIKEPLLDQSETENNNNNTKDSFAKVFQPSPNIPRSQGGGEFLTKDDYYTQDPKKEISVSNLIDDPVNTAKVAAQESTELLNKGIRAVFGAVSARVNGYTDQQLNQLQDLLLKIKSYTNLNTKIYYSVRPKRNSTDTLLLISLAEYKQILLKSNVNKEVVNLFEEIEDILKDIFEKSFAINRVGYRSRSGSLSFVTSFNDKDEILRVETFLQKLGIVCDNGVMPPKKITAPIVSDNNNNSPAPRK